jgi:hypothetical protein
MIDRSKWRCLWHKTSNQNQNITTAHAHTQRASENCNGSSEVQSNVHASRWLFLEIWMPLLITRWSTGNRTRRSIGTTFSPTTQWVKHTEQNNNNYNYRGNRAYTQIQSKYKLPRSNTLTEWTSRMTAEITTVLLLRPPCAKSRDELNSPVSLSCFFGFNSEPDKWWSADSRDRLLLYVYTPVCTCWRCETCNFWARLLFFASRKKHGTEKSIQGDSLASAAVNASLIFLKGRA